MAKRACAWVVLMLALPAAACSDTEAQDTSYANVVAAKFLKDAANIPPAPNAKAAKELQTLKTCSADRIRQSDIAYGDTDASINARIQEAMRYCSDQVYGPAKP